MMSAWGVSIIIKDPTSLERVGVSSGGMIYSIKSRRKKGGGTVKIRQQAQIRAFLVETFGTEWGNAMFAAQEKVLHSLTGAWRAAF